MDAPGDRETLPVGALVAKGIAEQEGTFINSSPVNAGQALSYKDLLMGFKGSDFNGVAYGESNLQNVNLLSDLKDQSWDLPIPSDELKKLMEVYPTMQMSHEEFNRWARPWNNSLIITILGAKINFYRLKEHLKRIWQTNGFELIDLPNNYYVVKFSDQSNWEQHYKNILFGGPWTISQHTILVQRWSPYFDPFRNSLGRIATWIRIPHVPLLCYNKECLWRLGDMIGKTLKVDTNTFEHSDDTEAKIHRGRYARICVELDLQKKLVPRIISASTLFNIEYEGLDLICFTCGRYGHRKEQCTSVVKSTGASSLANPNIMAAPAPKESSENLLPTNDNQFGPWMLVRKPARPQFPRKAEDKAQVGDVRNSRSAAGMADSLAPKSRYSILAGMDSTAEVIPEPLLISKLRNGKTEGNSEAQMVLEESRLTHGTKQNGNEGISISKKGFHVGTKHWSAVKNKQKDLLRPTSNGVKGKATKHNVDPKEYSVSTSKEPKKTITQRTHVLVKGNMQERGPQQEKDPKCGPPAVTLGTEREIVAQHHQDSDLDLEKNPVYGINSNQHHQSWDLVPITSAPNQNFQELSSEVHPVSQLEVVVMMEGKLPDKSGSHAQPDLR